VSSVTRHKWTWTCIYIFNYSHQALQVAATDPDVTLTSFSVGTFITVSVQLCVWTAIPSGTGNTQQPSTRTAHWNLGFRFVLANTIFTEVISRSRATDRWTSLSRELHSWAHSLPQHSRSTIRTGSRSQTYPCPRTILTLSPQIVGHVPPLHALHIAVTGTDPPGIPNERAVC